MDLSMKQMIKLIEKDADSFAKKAEMYYQKKLELIGLVDEFHCMHRSLAERYENITGELRKASPLKLKSHSEISSSDLTTVLTLGTPSAQCALGCDIYHKDRDDSASKTESELESDDSSDYVSIGSDFQSLSKRVTDLEIELRELKKRPVMQLEGNTDQILLSREENESKFVDYPAKLAVFEKELRDTNKNVKDLGDEVSILKGQLARYLPSDSDDEQSEGTSSTQDMDSEASCEEVKITSPMLHEGEKHSGIMRKQVGKSDDAKVKILLNFLGEGECSYNFDLEDIYRSSPEILGNGSYGISYKVTMEDDTIVVVKRLKNVTAGKSEYEEQMEIINRVGQHPSLAPLRAYHFSKDEKLLIYDYYRTGNRESERMPLDWESIRKITLSIAKGIAHLHVVGGPTFSHGNIKSSNVFMKRVKNEICVVSDFGLTPLMIAGAGYAAPEVIEERKHTHKSDIYSFGVLILEMLTRKTPLQSPSQNGMVDLPRWMQSVVREERTSEVFDVELMRFHNIETMVLLKTAMACVVQMPEERPTMDELVSVIEKIGVSVSETTHPTFDENSKPQDSTGQTIL
ncbi:predicted protein [Arabidopsis lyrata subsp. lyrata]|uniref:Predicted protein n=1 Tax=Arabidopsis lyrata subsp. lyrata TaxID=81972 RepID=D7LMA5_ARALL|nr:predicted protein [Arabidopsis lyrata subsp. lyrata]